MKITRHLTKFQVYYGIFLLPSIEIMDILEFSTILQKESEPQFLGPREKLKRVSRNYFSFYSFSKTLFSLESLLLFKHHRLALLLKHSWSRIYQN
jgi:hypothetical protein